VENFILRFVLAALSVFGFSSALNAQLQVQVTSSVPAPQPVGTEVVFTFSATDGNSNPGVLNFKLEVAQPQSATFTMVRDFEVSNTFAWARNLMEGSYQIRVTARDSNYLTATSQTVIIYKITSRVIGPGPVVNGTTHPLVALFSAPSCPAGSSMEVVFQPVGSTGSPFKTNFVNCNGKTSMNFLIAGMLPNASYSMFDEVGKAGASLQKSASVTWTTGTVPSSVLLVPVTFPIPFGPAASQAERILLLSFSTTATLHARNNQGKVVWYYAGDGAYRPGAVATAQLDRLLVGGFLLTSCGYPGDYTGTGLYGNQTGGGESLQMIDLTGHVVQETNVDRVNEQLIAMGTDPISTFNHDIRMLPNGHIMAITNTQKVFPAGTQGSAAPIDIIGTELVELDQNFQVYWYWDSFDHAGGNGQLDITRTAPLNEQCTTSITGMNGCPAVLLTSPANDWLHTNAVQYQPLDGSLVISIRNQDWVAKIDYNNGTGTGNILWLMGQNGSFAMNNVNGDPWPWFSHQHDVEYQNNGNVLMTMFDNGNTRITANGGDSRGYVLNVNESGLLVTPQLFFDTGYYAVAQGSAQVLSNGDYEFMGGQIVGRAPGGSAPSPSFYEQGAEVTPAGVATFSEAAQSQAYRLWRLTDFYNVPTN
jgi:hypothetical protein